MVSAGTAAVSEDCGINPRSDHGAQCAVSEVPPLLAGSPLSRNVGWTLTGNIVYAASQWALLIVLAKMSSPEQVGQLALGLALTGPLFVMSQLHLRGVQATDARCQFSFGDYLGLRWISTLVALLITVGLALGFNYRTEVALIIIIVGLARAFDNISDIYYGALLQHERMARMGKSLMLKGVLAVAGVVAGVLVTGGALGATTGIALAYALTFVFYDRHSVVFGSPCPSILAVEVPRWNPSGYIALFRLSLPLAVVMMLVSLNLNLPRYFIEKYQGQTDLGIFAALFYLIVVGNTAVTACGQAATPRLAKFYAYGQIGRFWRLLLGLLALGAVCGVLGLAAAALAGKEILAIVYSQAYSRHASLLVGLMSGAALLYVSQFLGYAMTAAQIFRPQVPLFVVVVATTALACWLLVPAYGLQGAVLATIAGFVAQFLGSAAILLHGCSIRQPRG
jgi:O-antigen/teichoic acid export membrane protein